MKGVFPMEEKDFTIRDRRSSASENADESAQQAVNNGADTGRQQPSDTPETEARKEAAPPLDLDFSSFILSLATTVQVSLGAIPNPQTNLQAQNLPAAKQMIDIINMLKEKTKGNLSREEQGLIDSILYNLRIHYIRTLEGKK
jgi:hypothetical protein